jgi:lipopolysaccharide assembly protein A
MRVFAWVVRALVLFVLFAFALNNRHEAVVHGFFGTTWRSPLVIVILAAFAAGCAVGVLALTPAWWRKRREPQRAKPAAPASIDDTMAPSQIPADTVSGAAMTHPPREAL